MLEAEGADVHEDVIDGVLGFFVVYDVRLFAVIVGDGLVAEIRADLGEQCGVEGDGDGVRGAGEHFPLDGCDLGIEAIANLEEVDLAVAFGTDGVGAVGVGVEARGLLAAVAKRADHLKGVPVGFARLEEQGLCLEGQSAGRGAGVFARVLYDLIVGALGERRIEVSATLDITCPRVHGIFANFLAVGLGNVELAIIEVLGEALLLGHRFDALGVEAVLGVVEVNLVVEVADVGVKRGDVIGELHGDPLMAGKCGEQPGLIVVGDDNLVVAAGALVVDDLAEELDTLTCRGAFAQDYAAVAIFANASIGQGVRSLGSCIHVGGQRGGAGDTLLVDASLGVGIPALVPLTGVVTHIGVAIRGLGRGIHECRLIRAVGVTRAKRRLDAKVLEVTLAVVLSTAVVRITVGRQLVAHIDLRAGERRGRHGHDGCSSKGEAYA